MYDYLNNMFTDNLDLIIRDFDELKKVQKYHSESSKLYENYKKNLTNLENKILLEKRKIEHNSSEYNKMVYETNMLKNFLIFVLCLFFIPILRLAGILNKALTVLLFFTILIAGISTCVYLVFSHNKNRDNIFYDLFNFKKPDNEKITTESP